VGNEGEREETLKREKRLGLNRRVIERGLRALLSKDAYEKKEKELDNLRDYFSPQRKFHVVEKSFFMKGGIKLPASTIWKEKKGKVRR